MNNRRHQELAEEVANFILEKFPNTKIESIHDGLEENTIWITVLTNGHDSLDIIESVSEKCTDILLEYGCGISVIPVAMGNMYRKAERSEGMFHKSLYAF